MSRRALRELVLRVKTKGLPHAQKEIKGLGAAWKQMRSPMMTTMKLGAGLTAGLAAATGAAAAVTGLFGRAIVQTGAQMEIYNTQLEVVMGSAKAAKGLMSEIVTMAAETPFEISDLVASGVILEQFKLDARSSLEVIGDAAGALSKDISMAASAVAIASTGEFERLKVSFGITIAAIEEELGHKIGRKTTQELADNVDAILNILERKYAGGMEKLAVTWQGTMSMYADALFRLKYRISGAGIFDGVKTDAQDLLKIINELEEQGAFTGIAIGFERVYTAARDRFLLPFIRDFETVNISAVGVALSIEGAFNNLFNRLNVLTSSFALMWSSFAMFFEAEMALQVIEDFKAMQAAIEKFNEDANVSAVALQLIGKGTFIDGNFQAFIDGPSDVGAKSWEEVAEALKVIESVLVRVNLSEAAAAAQTLDAAIQGMVGQTQHARLEAGDTEKEAHIALLDEVLDAETNYHLQRMSLTEAYSSFYISTLDLAKQQTADAYNKMSAYQEYFVVRGMNLGRVLNAMLIRGFGEVGKAGIAQLTRRAKIEALSYAADALALAAMGNFAAASVMAGAAAKKGAVVAAGGLASAYIERMVQEREQALVHGQMEDNLGGGGYGGADRTRSRGAATVSRTGPETQIITVLINNNIGGDYNVSSGDLSDAEQIAELIEDGTIPV